MIFEQIATGGCQSYLIGCADTCAGALIDPETSQVDRYLGLAARDGLRIRFVIDTHTHADHFSASRRLAERLGAMTVMHRASPAPGISMRVDDGESIVLGKLRLQVLHTPGHTADSMCLVGADRVFTGDTLLIGGTGRTDLPSGDPEALYDSLFGKLLALDPALLVYPAHDYKGETVSTIGEERAFNPRLQVSSIDDYVELMNNLKLPNPKMMDVAVPANMRIGLAQQIVADRGWALSAEDAKAALDDQDVALIDLREVQERKRDGVIPGSVHVTYPNVRESLQADGLLQQLARSSGKRLIFYCSFGLRSAMAVQAAQAAGLERSHHIHGGIQAWKEAAGPLIR